MDANTLLDGGVCWRILPELVTSIVLSFLASSLNATLREWPPLHKCDGIAVRTTPAVPRAGTLFRLAMPWSSGATPPAATVAGEPLHFTTNGDTLSAIAAVPIDSATAVILN